MSRSRSRGSRSRQRRSRRTTGGGVAAGSRSQTGSLVTTAASTSVTVSPANAGSPASISYSTAPKAQMSARRSTGFPLACSGDMYAAVPMITPSAVIAGDVKVGDAARSGAESAGAAAIALASPKSSTFTTPSSRTLMLAGLRSRCTMPRACASSSASAICRAMASASSTGTGPRASRRARSSPSTSSIARARVGPSWTTP
jgi:hypothetical protein